MADRNDHDLLLRLAVDLKRKDYEKVIAAGSLAKDDPLYNKSGIFICRALSETGKIDQAEAVLNDLLSALSPSDLDYIPAKLWSVFHYLFASESIAFEETLEELDKISQSSVSPDNLALKYALQSKTVSFAVAVGSFSPLRLSQSVELMELAAAKYLETGNLVEHAASVRSMAGMLQNAPFYDYTNAVEKLALLNDFTGYPDQIFLRGAVALDLAGIKFSNAPTGQHA